MISLWYRHVLSQVQQWSGVRYSCHAGICGAACQDAAADARADDHRQPSDGRSADPAGGGTYTPNRTSVSLYKKFTPGGELRRFRMIFLQVSVSLTTLKCVSDS